MTLSAQKVQKCCHTRKDLPTDLTLNLDLHKITPFPMTVPCLNGVGSCEYEVILTFFFITFFLKWFRLSFHNFLFVVVLTFFVIHRKSLALTLIEWVTSYLVEAAKHWHSFQFTIHITTIYSNTYISYVYHNTYRNVSIDMGSLLHRPVCIMIFLHM